MLLDFCLHWLASPEEPLEFKVPVLELLRSIVKTSPAIQASSRLLTLFFAVLTNRKNCSDDLQFALALLDWGELPSLLPAFFENVSEERMLSLWGALCLLEPVSLPEVLALL